MSIHVAKFKRCTVRKQRKRFGMKTGLLSPFGESTK